MAKNCDKILHISKETQPAPTASVLHHKCARGGQQSHSHHTASLFTASVVEEIQALSLLDVDLHNTETV